MVIHLTDFVYGDITMSEISGSSSKRRLTDNNGNSMEITIGDKLIICTSTNQKWIEDGTLTDFEENDRFILNDIANCCVKGCGYIGILAE